MEDRRSEVRAAILAGGRASRLGGDKATADLAGRPLISYPLEAAEAAGLDPFVVAKPDSRLPPLGCEVVRETERPSHPLVGALAALERAPDGVVLLGCDMPFLTAPLLAWVASLASPAVACVDGLLEPLLGVYDSGAAGAFSRALADQDSLRRAVAGIRPRRIDRSELEPFGAPERLTFSVNSPDDLAGAARMLAG